MKEETLDAFLELRLNGHREIFLTEYEGLEFIYRPLVFSEYEGVLALEEQGVDAPSINDTILKRCVLHPEGGVVEKWLDRAKAATPDLFAQEILDKSSFDDNIKMLDCLEKARASANNIPSFLEVVICSVYRALTPTEVNRMTLKEQLELFAKAETMFNPQVDIAEIIKSDSEVPQGKPNIPVPEGMETTDLLSPELAGIPDLGNIFN